MIIRMQEDRDCLVAALATAKQVSWEQAAELIGHRNLRSIFTSLIYSTHWKLRSVLKKHNIPYREVSEMHEFVPGRTIVLTHETGNFLTRLFVKHWVVYMGEADDGRMLFAWGDSSNMTVVSRARLTELFYDAWPTCAFILT